MKRQVPSKGIPRGYILLLCRHGIFGSRDTRSLLQDTFALLHPSGIQLYPFLPSALPTSGLSSTSFTEVGNIVHERFKHADKERRFDPSSGLLRPSLVLFEEPPPLHTKVVLRILEALHLVKLERVPIPTPSGTNASTTGKPPLSDQSAGTGQIVSSTNLTILNFMLVHFGPLHEKSLCTLMGVLQVACSVLAFAIRYGAAGWVYGGERR
jgi:hypothetical protein